MTEKVPSLPSPSAVLSEDRTEILISQSAPPPLAYRLTTAALEETIQRYGSVRAGMVPAVPSDWGTQEGESVEVRRNPSWVIGFEALTGDPILHIRHEGFGWLHFLIDRDDARKFGGSLTALANAPPPEAAGRA
jgi:hypothetical protein